MSLPLFFIGFKRNQEWNKIQGEIPDPPVKNCLVFFCIDTLGKEPSSLGDRMMTKK